MGFYQGDVLLAKVYFSDLSDAKVRPVVVVSKNSLNNKEDLLVLKMTTTITRMVGTVQIGADEVDFDLNRHSEIRCEDILTLHTSFIIKKLGRLQGGVLDQVIEKAKKAFDKE